ncbi:RuBisCO large subunit C-terminal-like domain-containing protein [Clostridium magnum]|uniref:2,3-diketo-5-methylthiopentyl-1-phosphate enolase n=1 Tax=Clostridium magnum DSM 2767 TaxID=1121326 RepID=A0A162QUJ3_9CLOT|nr:RuBisCO large subunit C-terminal-like domain-containing protein [Clostridium magnum]KZL88985.1 2,3-diketo-5-methylthiopentyl-1-phosphate enolase [Clostridium magnum DSM 2767]SHI23470.1 2,3-diketo-5-methylthiopentyl-1-phosphate enolase [Clostridium magnum DSM 2767]
MEHNFVYGLMEDIRDQDYAIASYYIELDCSIDPYEKAKTFAIGQTIGTWVPVPGITDEMRRNHMGKVVQIFDFPPADLTTQKPDDNIRSYIFQIAYPVINFEANFPMMITTLLGNDASTSSQAKLVDLQLPDSFINELKGPNFGVKGLRKLCGVEDRPLLLNMIKPCTGFSPETGAKIFYDTALGGVDFIKDDELLGNPSFCPLEDRVKAYNKASEAAYEVTGKRTIYIPNITDSVDKIFDNATKVIEAGAKMVMVSFSAVGYSTLHALAKTIKVPIFGHYAGTGPYYEGPKTGMSSPIAVGKFPRLAGADGVMINTPYGGYPLERQKYLRTYHELSLPLKEIKPTLTSCGGGVNPGIVGKFIKDLGTDIMLAPGGAVQGHPMGAAAGVHAMLQAIEASMHKIPMEEAVKDHKELKAAIDLWGYVKS